MFSEKDPYIGKVCASSDGSIAIVLSKIDVTPKGVKWFGLSINGGIWRSRHPKVISNNIFEYININKIKLENVNSMVLGISEYIDSTKKEKELSKDAFFILSRENEKLQNKLNKIDEDKKELIIKPLEKEPEPEIVDLIDKAVDNEVKSYISVIRKITDKDPTGIISKVVLKIQERNKERKIMRRKKQNA